MLKFISYHFFITNYRPTIEKYGQIPIHLQGIDIMWDDPSEVKVLYAKLVNKTEVLQKIVDEIVDYYVKIGKTANNIF